MRILYLCPDLGIPVLGRKGASVHVRELAGAFHRAGHRITVVAQTLLKSPWEAPTPFDVPLLRVRARAATSNAIQVFKQFNETLGANSPIPGELRRILYNQDLFDAVCRKFEKSPPDFIYERASLLAIAGVKLARKFGVPHLVELNAPLAVEQSAYRSTGFGRLAAEAERWLLIQADAVLAVSTELKKHALSLGVAESQIHVIPNAVNPDLFKPGKPDVDLRQRLQLQDAPVLGFVGGLRPWHGVEVLPKLLARVQRRHHGVRLVIAGDGPLRDCLERDFRRHALQGQVTFTGLLLHEDIPNVIRQFDVALAPYPKLNHDFYFSPLKLFEYMACGVPVVASDAGQIREVVRHQKTGLLCVPGDLDGLARSCGRLLSNGNLRRTLGRAAARAVARKFTWDRNVERVIAVARATSIKN